MRRSGYTGDDVQEKDHGVVLQKSDPVDPCNPKAFNAGSLLSSLQLARVERPNDDEFQTQYKRACQASKCFL